MTSTAYRIKEALGKVPYSLARPLVYVPYALRFGAAYPEAGRLIQEFSRSSNETRERMILTRLQNIVEYAYESIPFYRHWYQTHRYQPHRLRTLSHFDDVPLTDKRAFRSFGLDQRSSSHSGSLKLNTGGSSGTPLEFYVDKHAFAREWAHMHHIWAGGGYAPTDLKLTLRGKDLGTDALRYNVVHNEYIGNAYVSPELLVEAVEELNRVRRIRWIHGYPSLVAEFAEATERLNPSLAASLRSKLKGVLLGSEFPAPHYRGTIERLLSPNVIAWYGHSEMVVLAVETGVNVYRPYQSYGYCEAVPAEDGHYRLVGTSYANRVTPFIRYDTDDRIQTTGDDTVLSAFSISEGRVGDFVTRADGSRVSLTALVFGRHHDAFEMVEHVQIREDRPGSMTVLVVPRKAFSERHDEVLRGFNFDSAGLSVTYEFLDEPVRTARGKVPLLVHPKPVVDSPPHDVE